MNDLEPRRVQEGSVIGTNPEPQSQIYGPIVLRPGEVYKVVWIPGEVEASTTTAIADDSEIRTTVTRQGNGNWEVLAENMSMIGREISFSILLSLWH